MDNGNNLFRICTDQRIYKNVFSRLLYFVSITLLSSSTEESESFPYVGNGNMKRKNFHKVPPPLQTNAVAALLQRYCSRQSSRAFSTSFQVFLSFRSSFYYLLFPILPFISFLFARRILLTNDTTTCQFIAYVLSLCNLYKILTWRGEGDTESVSLRIRVICKL